MGAEMYVEGGRAPQIGQIRRVQRSSHAIRRMLRLALFLVLAVTSPGNAIAQETPIGIAPLRTDPDPNGVNLFTGKVTLTGV